MFGLLNLHKPSGMTSRRVVDRVQRLVYPDKTGHAGTLDPLASGVLVVGIGPATRLISYVQQQRKRYRATFLLGFTSPTEDIEGEVCPVAGAAVPDRAEILAAAARLTGNILQRPPVFSALKVAGRRAYALARAGQEVELRPRPITIYGIELIDYSHPQLQLDIECSAGTYVRSLGRDLAESLGTGAVMSALVRTAIGQFTLERSIELDKLSAETMGPALHDPLAAVAHLPQLQLTGAEVTRVLQGRTISVSDRLGAASLAGENPEVVAVDAAGRLVALLAPLADGELRPTRCFVQ
jgi:tRNA pseudouridine55 synthase